MGQKVETERSKSHGIDPVDMVMFPFWAYVIGWAGATLGIPQDWWFYIVVAFWMVGIRVKRFVFPRAPVYTGNTVANVGVFLLLTLGGLPLTLNALAVWTGSGAIGGMGVSVASALLLAAAFGVDGWRRSEARRLLAASDEGSPSAEVELEFPEDEDAEEATESAVQSQGRS